MNHEKVKQHYLDNKEIIENRVNSFKSLKNNSSEERLFQELVFVILTSQSSAKQCWECSRKLDELNLLINGGKDDITEVIETFDIQYSRNKASYIVENRKELSQPSFANPEPELNLRDKISEDNISRTREWMAENLQGVSWKGASHFLRNIGYGLKLAVFSKPLMIQLNSLGAVKGVKVPKDKESYLEAEESFVTLADSLNLLPVELDLALWSMETGEVFK